MIEISIVIPSFNSVPYVKKCLDSVFAQSYKEFEVFLVDNGSSDQTVGLVENNFPRVNIIRNHENKGFPFACNQGIKASCGKYILILNADVMLESGFLEGIHKSAEKTEADIGMISPKILQDKDKARIDSTGLLLSRARRFFDRGSAQIDSGKYDNNNKILGPCAAAALYKREMLEDIKSGEEYFDPDFFLLLEDFDLAWRASNSGWKTLFCAQARCYHLRNLSSSKTQYVQYLSFRNRYLLMLKNENISSFLVNILFILPYDVLRLPYFLLTNKYALKALWELRIMAPKMFRKRRLIGRIKTASFKH